MPQRLGCQVCSVNERLAANAVAATKKNGEALQSYASQHVGGRQPDPHVVHLLLRYTILVAT